MGKRGRGRRGSSNAKRPRLGLDPVQDRCQEIADFLQECEAGPLNLRQALQAMLPFAAASAKKERSQEQTSVLKMVYGWLEKAEAELKEGAQSADAAINMVEGEKSTREQSLNEAAEAVEAETKRFHAAQRQLREDINNVGKAEQEYALIQHEVANWDEDQVTKAEERDQCKDVIETMSELKDLDRSQQSREKKRLNFVLEYLRSIDIEETLVTTIPMALGWSRANVVRGRFDDIALEEVKQRLDAHHKKLDERANGGDELKQQYIAKEAAEKKHVEEAIAKKVASEEAIKAAEDRVEELEQEQMAAKDAVKNFDNDVAKAHQHKATVVFNLSTLTTDIKAKFQWLLDWEDDGKDAAEEAAPDDDEVDEQDVNPN